VGVEKAKGVVLCPVGNFFRGHGVPGCGDRAFQEQQVTDGENVATGTVFDIVRSAVSAEELESAGLVAVFQELQPAFLDEGGERGREEIVKPAADDVFARETEKFTRADAGFLIVAIIIGDQDWRRRVEDDGTEKRLEFADPVFGEPGREGTSGSGRAVRDGARLVRGSGVSSGFG
jgi:hypothetical protein